MGWGYNRGRMETTMKYIMTIVLACAFVVAGGCGERKNIILTGYWPPTNEMIRPFSADPGLNPGGWKGENYKGLGYDVYAYFPTFEGGTAANPKGDGDFQVDYQKTYEDFYRVTGKLRPVAIISYGLGDGPWEVETKAINLSEWVDDYLEPKRPGVVPAVGSVDADEAIPTSLPAAAIAEAVNRECAGVNAWVDTEGDPGGFLCNYMCLLGSDYALRYANEGVAAGFIHVGKDVSVEEATKANEVTLDTVIENIKKADAKSTASRRRKALLIRRLREQAMQARYRR